MPTGHLARRFERPHLRRRVRRDREVAGVGLDRYPDSVRPAVGPVGGVPGLAGVHRAVDGHAAGGIKHGPRTGGTRWPSESPTVAALGRIRLS